jgi:hypothetical protein
MWTAFRLSNGTTTNCGCGWRGGLRNRRHVDQRRDGERFRLRRERAGGRRFHVVESEAGLESLEERALTVAAEALGAADSVMARWGSLRAVDLPALNAALKAAGLPAIAGGSGR